MELDLDAARASIGERLAAPLGMSIEEAAYGVHNLVNENMTNAACTRLNAERIFLSCRFSHLAAPARFTPGASPALGVRVLIAPPAAGVVGNRLSYSTVGF